jgi:hypothetical protein
MDELPQVGVIRTGGKRLRLCAKCWTEMITIKSLQYMSERCVRDSGSCEVCGFESEVGVSADKLKPKTPPRAGQASA